MTNCVAIIFPCPYEFIHRRLKCQTQIPIQELLFVSHCQFVNLKDEIKCCSRKVKNSCLQTGTTDREGQIYCMLRISAKNYRTKQKCTIYQKMKMFCVHKM